MLIIPTLRLMSDYSFYEPMIQLYAKFDISTIRINFSRHDPEEYLLHLQHLTDLCNISDYKVQWMFDLPLPADKIRLAIEPDTDIRINKGEIIAFSDSVSLSSENRTVPVEKCDLTKRSNVGDTIFIGDGEIEFRTIDLTSTSVITEAQNNRFMKQSIMTSHRDRI